MPTTQNEPDESGQPLLPEKLNRIVYRILSEADSELADWYLGAHKTLEDTSNPERYVGAAHSIRELIEKLPYKHNRAVQIQRPPSILSSSIYEARDAWTKIVVDKDDPRSWTLPNSDRTSKFLKSSEKFWTWFSKFYGKRSEQRLALKKGIQKGTPLPGNLAGEQLKKWGEYASKFTSISHHQETPSDFYSLLSEFEDFLIRELDPQTTKDFVKINQIIKLMEGGEDKNLPELIRLVRSNRANYDHFFLQITSPMWLNVLEENDLINHIDDPIPAKGGAFIIPNWSPGQYFERVAAAEPSKVEAIISSIPITDNPRVHEGLVDIAKKLPKEQTGSILSALQGWLKKNFSGLLPFKVGELIEELAKKDAYDEAIKAFRILFELQPPPETDEYFRRPRTLTSETSYETILDSTVPSLMAMDGLGTIKELCALLNSGLILERDSKPGKNGLVYDGSTIWRPDIRRKEHHYGPSDILVSHLFASASEYATTPEKKLAVMKLLQGYKFTVFHRIAATIAEGDENKAVKIAYNKIVEKTGPPNSDDFLVSESNVVPAVSLNEMKKLSLEALIDLLNDWDPKENLPGFGRSKSDIGFVLSQYVENDSGILKKLFEGKRKLNPEYFSHVFRGARLASDNKRTVDWAALIRHAKAFVDSSNTKNSEGEERETQFALVGAITSGVDRDNIKITSPEVAEEVIEILSPLTNHAEPTIEYERKWSKRNRTDSVGLAINSMRGEALSGLIAILKNASRSGGKINSGLSKEQRERVYGILEEKLDPKIEQTLAVRTVLARELPFLAYDNQNWVKKNLDKLFILDPKNERYFVDAMEAFLQFTRPYPEVFPVVEPYLIEYLKRVQSGRIKSDDDNTVNHVVGQILLLYIDEFAKLESEVMKELAKMPDAYLEEAMDFFGRDIRTTSGDRQKLVLEKAKAYWQARLDSGDAKKAEYSKFGWWLRASAADQWIKDKFSDALKKTDEIDALYFVADEIIEMAQTNKAAAADLLLQIVDTQNSDNLINMLHTPELRAELQQMLKSAEPGVKDVATRVIDKLLGMGFYNFQELLEDDTK